MAVRNIYVSKSLFTELFYYETFFRFEIFKKSLFHTLHCNANPHKHISIPLFLNPSRIGPYWICILYSWFQLSQSIQYAFALCKSYWTFTSLIGIILWMYVTDVNAQSFCHCRPVLTLLNIENKVILYVISRTWLNGITSSLLTVLLWIWKDTWECLS